MNQLYLAILYSILVISIFLNVYLSMTLAEEMRVNRLLMEDRKKHGI